MPNIYEWNDPFESGRKWREEYDKQRQQERDRARESREVFERVEAAKARQYRPDPIGYDPPPPGPGPFPKQDTVFTAQPSRRRKRFPWLMIFGFVIGVPALAFLALSFTGGGSDDKSERPSIATLRKANFAYSKIEPMTRNYGMAGRYSVANVSKPAYDRGFADLFERKPQIITCTYQIKGRPGNYSHEFWYGGQPPQGYEALIRLVPSGHLLRILGLGAITECPKTWGEGRDKLEAFWSKMPPAPPFRNE